MSLASRDGFQVVTIGISDDLGKVEVAPVSMNSTAVPADLCARWWPLLYPCWYVYAHSLWNFTVYVHVFRRIAKAMCVIHSSDNIHQSTSVPRLKWRFPILNSTELILEDDYLYRSSKWQWHTGPSTSYRITMWVAKLLRSFDCRKRERASASGSGHLDVDSASSL